MDHQLPLPLFDAPPPPAAPAAPDASGPARVPRPILGEDVLTRDARRRLEALAGEDPRLRTLAPRVRVVWNPRLRNSAGRAFFHAARIELNLRITQVDDAEETERTLLHELAHLVAFHRAATRRDGSPLFRPCKIAAHGPEWQQACADLGIPGEQRCHSLDLAPRRKLRPRFAFVCPACKEILLRVKPLSRHSACHPCCKRHNQNRYDARFEFIPLPLDDALNTLKHRENGRR